MLIWLPAFSSSRSPVLHVLAGWHSVILVQQQGAEGPVATGRGVFDGMYCCSDVPSIEAGLFWHLQCIRALVGLLENALQLSRTYSMVHEAPSCVVVAAHAHDVYYTYHVFCQEACR